MKPFLLAAALAAALLAGCDSDPADSPTSAAPPATASGGASAGVSSTGPAGEKMGLPEAPKGSVSGNASAETKPDPGDANDHSNPQHDAKNKKDGD
jgi:hypothetical protein